MGNENGKQGKGNPQGKRNPSKSSTSNVGRESSKNSVVTYSNVVIMGEGKEGQLGLGANIVNTNYEFTPIPSFSPHPIHYLYFSSTQSFFIDQEGNTYATGKDVEKLSTDSTNNLKAKSEYSPILLNFPFKDKCIQVACGNSHVLLLTSRGSVWGWGASKEGALGFGAAITSTLKPKQIEGLPPVSKIATSTHSIAITREGKIYVWGSSDDGKLGIGQLDYNISLVGKVSSPMLLDTPYTQGKLFVDIACGSGHSIFISRKGEVLTCGRGTEGQLGYGGQQHHFFPRLIHIMASTDKGTDAEKFFVVFAIKTFAFQNLTAVITNQGGVYLWGNGAREPTEISFEEPIVHLSLHPTRSLFLSSSKKIYTFSPELLVSDGLEELRGSPLDEYCNASYVACSSSHVGIVSGGRIPTLYNDDVDKMKESIEVDIRNKHADKLRSELFDDVKPKRNTNTSSHTNSTYQTKGSSSTGLNKMKEDLFSVPPPSATIRTNRTDANKKKSANSSATTNNNNNRNNNNAKNSQSNDNELEEFQRELFGDQEHLMPPLNEKKKKEKESKSKKETPKSNFDSQAFDNELERMQRELLAFSPSLDEKKEAPVQKEPSDSEDEFRIPDELLHPKKDSNSSKKEKIIISPSSPSGPIITNEPPPSVEQLHYSDIYDTDDLC